MRVTDVGIKTRFKVSFNSNRSDDQMTSRYELCSMSFWCAPTTNSFSQL